MDRARLPGGGPRLWWALAWIAAGVASVGVELVAAARSSVPYSFAQQTISDLGMTTCADVAYERGPVAICSPAHALANGMWAVAAVAIVVGAVGVRTWLGGGRAATTAAAGAVVGGLGQLGVAAWPIDVDLAAHAIAGLVGFVGQNVALVAAGLALRRRRLVSALALLGGVVGLLATALVPAAEGLGMPIGIVERLAVYPFLVGIAALGLLALADRRARGRVRPA